MQKPICILFCLLVLGHALNSTNQTNSSSNNTNPKQSTSKVGVTKSGNVPLYKNARGFYAGVDLLRDDSTWPYFGPNSVAMELGLYTSQTLLVSDCMSFTKYNCQRYQCSQHTWVYNTIPYPYFTAAGNTASAQVYLDYSHWSLNDYALIALSCSSQASSDYGKDGMSGILGLGLISQEGTSNYGITNPIFSLYLRPVNNLDGYLMFEKDLRYAASSQSIAKWTTDKNWKGTLSGYVQVGGSASISLTSVSLILDAATNITGFPSSIYASIVRGFGYAGIQCTGAYTKPTCSYGSYKSRLPTITISLSYPSSGTISLPPEIYVFNYSSYSNQTFISSFTLNMKALGSGLTQENYVTPSFDNTIILSSDVLSQYYIVFDGSNSYSPSISLYTASKNPPVPGSIPGWGFVVGAVILAGIICACCRCCYRPKVINVRTSPGAPLILNDQTQFIQPVVAPVINYSYPQPVYTQQPQIIVQPQPQVIIQQPQPVISQQPQGFYNAPPTYNYN